MNRKQIQNQYLRSLDEKAVVFDSELNLGEARQQFVGVQNQQFMDKLRVIIENNLENVDYSVDNLCLDIGVSRSKLYARIKSMTQDTLGVFIREIRMQRAAELLRTTNYPIYEVAFKVGIGSASFFTRSFKQRFDVSPTDYAKRYM